MAKLVAPVVITANCLATGAVLYLGPARRWLGNFAGAQVYEDLSAATATAADVDDPGAVIGVELVAVKISGSGAEPRHYREAIRACGPGAYALPGETGDNRVPV